MPQCWRVQRDFPPRQRRGAAPVTATQSCCLVCQIFFFLFNSIILHEYTAIYLTILVVGYNEKGFCGHILQIIL